MWKEAVMEVRLRRALLLGGASMGAAAAVVALNLMRDSGPAAPEPAPGEIATPQNRDLDALLAAAPAANEPEAPGAPAPAPTSPTTLRVHVMGAVRHAGVYSVPTGARVQDAIDAAGGAAPGADLEAINLADFLKDGEQVHLPARARRPPPRERVERIAGTRATLGHLPGRYPAVDAAPAADAPAAGGTTSVRTAAATGTINLNTATAAELEALPGVGPAIAAAIVAHRNEHGAFVRVEDVLEVRGIGEKKFQAMKSMITVQ
jgi:competence protein ComEA